MAKSSIPLTLERLKQVLSYDAETGIFRSKIRRGKIAPGDILGSNQNMGYSQIVIDWHLYLSHRLAWFYVTGKWPKDRIDHKDMNRKNNRFVNLREATHSQNLFNRGPNITNTSGYKGVSWDKSRLLWNARININNKCHHLGRFDDIEKAHAAYCGASKKLHGEFSNSGDGK